MDWLPLLHSKQRDLIVQEIFPLSKHVNDLQLHISSISHAKIPNNALKDALYTKQGADWCQIGGIVA